MNADTSVIDMAAWLLKHVDAIALHPAADEFLDELKQRVGEIERMINRPAPYRDLGTCPTVLADGYGQRVCLHPLTAKMGQTDIQCAGCGTPWNVEKLIRFRVDEADDTPFTQRQILDIMAQIGEPIPMSTWRTWRVAGKLIERQEWYVAEPKYRLRDVRELREKHGAHRVKRQAKS
ncbi:hypothetical protein ACAG26_24260 [Mycobacterium sp. pUA109]|uniref:hypothetical protein n=1 Tax=Mycobacterium sp. pUA109 TaxID=3238982 RepID=UPI00351B376F